MEQSSAALPLDSEAGIATQVTFKNRQGVEVQAYTRRITPQAVVFEIHGSLSVIQLNDQLSEFRIVSAHGHLLYNGTAAVSAVVTTGTATVCQATLATPFQVTDPQPLRSQKGLSAEFAAFFRHWQTFLKISPSYKLAVAELQSFLGQLRVWLDQIELGIGTLPVVERTEVERRVLLELAPSVSATLHALFERFELEASAVAPEYLASHQAFCQQQLHPLLLCSPFMHRIFVKPLGYAGDYEMVNMILRNPAEGNSLFGKFLNVFILSQTPAEAHRNRIQHLLRKLTLETDRLRQQGQVCRIFSLGCGPAHEVQKFLSSNHLGAHAAFTLLDCNDETLQYVARALQACTVGRPGAASVNLIKKSVQQFLKAKEKAHSAASQFDFIYCAGLFDYLSDRLCRAVMTAAYDSLSPGGLLLVTNVEPTNPIRNIMEHIYAWHLIYRQRDELASLASELPSEASRLIECELTSSNIFLEVRKPPLNP